MSDVDQIVAWAERQADVEGEPTKRAQGRAGHLSPQEKHAIRLAYLETGCTLTFKALAARFNVNRDTVSACLKGPEYIALEKHFDDELRSTAVSRLKALTMPAVEAWGDAIPIAALRGDHKPARELLQHVGVIEEEQSSGVTVIVGGGTVNIGVRITPDGAQTVSEPDSPFTQQP